MSRDYPIYVVGARGVQRLQWSDAKQEVAAVRDFNCYGCIARDAIAHIKGKLYYISTNEMISITAGKTQAMPMPHQATTLARIADMLVAIGETTYVYDLKSKIWSLIDCDLRGKVNDNDEWLVDNEGDIATLVETPAEGEIVTRPIKQCADAVDVKEIEVIGKFRPGHVYTVLHGSNHLCHWHLIASAKDSKIYDVNASRYRYHRVTVILHLEDDEWIHGLMFSC